MEKPPRIEGASDTCSPTSVRIKKMLGVIRGYVKGGWLRVPDSLTGEPRDPFDRILIAQAQAENLLLVSNERLFDGFGVQRLW